MFSLNGEVEHNISKEYIRRAKRLYMIRLRRWLRGNDIIDVIANEETSCCTEDKSLAGELALEKNNGFCWIFWNGNVTRS